MFIEMNNYQQYFSFGFAELISFGSFACLNQSYFLCLDAKKVTKKNQGWQIILGLLSFGLPTQYNSSR